MVGKDLASETALNCSMAFRKSAFSSGLFLMMREEGAVFTLKYGASLVTSAILPLTRPSTSTLEEPSGNLKTEMIRPTVPVVKISRLATSSSILFWGAKNIRRSADRACSKAPTDFGLWTISGITVFGNKTVFFRAMRGSSSGISMLFTLNSDCGICLKFIKFLKKIKKKRGGWKPTPRDASKDIASASAETSAEKRQVGSKLIVPTIDVGDRIAFLGDHHLEFADFLEMSRDVRFGFLAEGGVLSALLVSVGHDVVLIAETFDGPDLSSDDGTFGGEPPFPIERGDHAAINKSVHGRSGRGRHTPELREPETRGLRTKRQRQHDSNYERGNDTKHPKQQPHSIPFLEKRTLFLSCHRRSYRSAGRAYQRPDSSNGTLLWLHCVIKIYYHKEKIMSIVPVFSRRSVFYEFECLFGRVDYFINVEVFLVDHPILFIKLFSQNFIYRLPVIPAHKHYGNFLRYLFGLDQRYQLKYLIQRAKTAREKYIGSGGKRKHNLPDEEIMKSLAFLNIRILPLIQTELDIYPDRLAAALNSAAIAGFHNSGAAAGYHGKAGFSHHLAQFAGFFIPFVPFRGSCRTKK